MKKFPKHFAEEIICLAKQGFGPTEIARKFELNPISVNGFMLKNGFTQSKPGLENEETILKLFQQGYSPKQIADKLNIKYPTVGSILQKHKRYYNPIIDNPEYFSILDTPNKAYFLGFIAADGAIVNNKTGNPVLTISIHKKDIDILKTFKREIQSTHKIRHLKHRENMVRLAFSHPMIITSLLEMGITQRKSLTLGRIIDKIPFCLREPFIIGYFDGDGSVHRHSLNGKTVQFRGTYEFLNGIRDHLGFGSLVHKKTWVLRFHRFDQIKHFYSYYQSCDFFLQRKHEKFDECRTISSPYSSINRS